jgi:hypothetical protein
MKHDVIQRKRLGNGNGPQLDIAVDPIDGPASSLTVNGIQFPPLRFLPAEQCSIQVPLFYMISSPLDLKQRAALTLKRL